MSGRAEDRLAILIASRNRPDLVEEMVGFVQREVKVPHNLVVVECGTDQDKLTPHSTLSFADPDFRGKCFGHNLALRHAQLLGEHEYYWVLMNDLVFPPGQDPAAKLIATMAENPRMAILSPTCEDGLYPGSARRPEGGWHKVTTCDYLGFMMRGQAVREVGFLNPDFRYCWGAIHELAYHLYTQDWFLAYTSDVTYRHLGGSTYGQKGTRTISRQDYQRRAKIFAHQYMCTHYGTDWAQRFWEATRGHQIEIDTFSEHARLWAGSTAPDQPAAAVIEWAGEVKEPAAVGDRDHPWFHGVSFPTPEAGKLPPPPEGVDLSAPILFMARGHSGTTILARILARAGVFLGNPEDRFALNETWDSQYWTYGFQRHLLPDLWRVGEGPRLDASKVRPAAAECLLRHLAGCPSGARWGLKTCDGMFSHALYRRLFPRARYIHMVRDGRDVTLSGEGWFHLTNPSSRREHWDYFRLITCGLSAKDDCGHFRIPHRPEDGDAALANRYWIQARSWREHVRMVEHLRRQGELAEQVFTLRYEDLCRDPLAVLEDLFAFLDLELTPAVRDFACKHLHARSVGRWERADELAVETTENLAAVFASMAPELDLLGYLDDPHLAGQQSRPRIAARQLATSRPVRLLAWPRYDALGDLDALMRDWAAPLAGRDDACLCLRHDPRRDPPLEICQRNLAESHARILGEAEALEVLLVDDPLPAADLPQLGQALSWAVRLPSGHRGMRADFLAALQVPVLVAPEQLAAALEDVDAKSARAESFGQLSVKERQQVLEDLSPWYYPVRVAGMAVTAGRGTNWSHADLVNRTACRESLLVDAVTARCELAGRRVLDLACNCGYWSKRWAAHGISRVVGVEGRPQYVEQANLLWTANRVLPPDRFRFLLGDVTEQRTWRQIRSLGPFDLTLCAGLLYHIADYPTLLRRIREVTLEAVVVDTRVSDAPEAVITEPRDRWFNALPTKPDKIVPQRKKLLAAMSAASIVPEPLPVHFASLPGLQDVDDYNAGRRLTILGRVLSVPASVEVLR